VRIRAESIDILRRPTGGTQTVFESSWEPHFRRPAIIHTEHNGIKLNCELPRLPLREPVAAG